jgi:hypothetical protein
LPVDHDQHLTGRLGAQREDEQPENQNSRGQTSLYVVFRVSEKERSLIPSTLDGKMAFKSHWTPRFDIVPCRLRMALNGF